MATVLLSTKIDDFILYARGLAYNYDYSKWIPDVVSSTSGLNIAEKNKLSITPGKYYKNYFQNKKKYIVNSYNKRNS